MNKVAIVGVGTLPWRSNYDDHVWYDLALEATKKALNDARIPKESIDLVVYSIFCEIMIRQQIADRILHEYLGLIPKPTLRPNAGSAADIASLYTAYTAVASGMADTVLLLAVQKGGDLYSKETRSRGDGFQKCISLAVDTTWLAPILPGPPAFLTMAFLAPHIQKYGTPTPQQLARASVKNHRNALDNPEAQVKLRLSGEDVLNSRIIAWPTTYHQCCLYSDCAVALILASEKKAREITDKPVWISGIAECSYPTMRFEKETLGRMMGLNTAAQRAYRMAGIKDPMNELDIAEISDLISGVEITSYEEMGFCPPGEGARLIDEGQTEKTGKLPVNVTGGRVACGHVGGVSAIYSAAAITRQLKEEAGAMQVPIRHGKGVLNSIDGYGATAGVAILER